MCSSVSMISLEFSVHFSPLLGVDQVGCCWQSCREFVGCRYCCRWLRFAVVAVAAVAACCSCSLQSPHLKFSSPPHSRLVMLSSLSCLYSDLASDHEKTNMLLLGKEVKLMRTRASTTSRRLLDNPQGDNSLRSRNRKSRRF